MTESSPGSSVPLIVAITGASGAPYAVRLLQQLVESQTPVSLIVSSHGVRLLQSETEYTSIEDVRQAIGPDAWDSVVTVFDNNDRGAPPASGSALSRGMVICPCSMGTVSAIAHGSSRSLIERAADVILKERRKLLLVPRETPLSTIHLSNLLTLSQSGAVILPAAPGFYNRPTAIADLVDFIVSRILDHFSIPHNIGHRWTGK
jgi:4-hydroxy-3-polyprenylbenzoate decarboxylase